MPLPPAEERWRSLLQQASYQGQRTVLDAIRCADDEVDGIAARGAPDTRSHVPSWRW